MNTEQLLIETLQELIKSKNDYIESLKSEIERLKASQIVINPVPSPQSPPSNPLNPWPFIGPGTAPVGPYYPLTPINPTTPWYQPPFIITSVGGSTTTETYEQPLSTGDLPNCSIKGENLKVISTPHFSTTNRSGAV